MGQNRFGIGVAIGALVLGTACGTSRSATRTDTTTGTTQTPGQTQPQAGTQAPQLTREQAIAQADGSIAGQVQQLEGGRLTLDPYATLPTNPTVQLGEDVPVFQGSGTVSTRALMPGTDVEVFYQGEGEQRRAVAVQVLDPQAAQERRTAGEQEQARNDDRAQRDTMVAPEYLERADGSQPGVVKEVAEGFLILDPYQTTAGDARLQLSPTAPVFQGEGRVGTDALRSGVDVRVFYRAGSGDRKPEVVAVEILDPATAREIRTEIEDAPRR